MKKSIFVGVLIFTCVITIAFGLSMLMTDSGEAKESIQSIKKLYNEYSTDVDSAVNKFMSSDEYNKMSKETQVEVIGDLLKLYEQNNIITNLYYDETNLMYTFTYNYGDMKGALGGVKLKDWDPMMN